MAKTTGFIVWHHILAVILVKPESDTCGYTLQLVYEECIVQMVKGTFQAKAASNPKK